MVDQPSDVLSLRTGDSAGGIFAECLASHLGQGRFRGFSAGSHPQGEGNPLALSELQRNDNRIDGLRSEGWREFAKPGAPLVHFVFTVCDGATVKTCPVCPGHPMTAHRGVEDPSSAKADDLARKATFAEPFPGLQNRISIFVNLPPD